MYPELNIPGTLAKNSEGSELLLSLQVGHRFTDTGRRHETPVKSSFP